MWMERRENPSQQFHFLKIHSASWDSNTKPLFYNS